LEPYKDTDTHGKRDENFVERIESQSNYERRRTCLQQLLKDYEFFIGLMMSKSCRLWNPNQQWLLPPSVHDRLPENNLVYFVPDTVKELDISAITKKYEQEERGYPPYNPRMMVALCFIKQARGFVQFFVSLDS
jgi:hypothetical protein